MPNLPHDDETPLRNISQAARYLGVSPATIRNWIRAGKLRTVRLNKCVRLHVDELRRVANEGLGR